MGKQQETERDLQLKLQSFEDLLKQISSVDEKKRSLWLQIYQNAIEDRQCAHANYLVLLTISEQKSCEWAVHGRNLGVFLERMSKANDQLLKLADLVSREIDREKEVSPSEIFNRIQGN